MKQWQQFQSANAVVDFRGRMIEMQSTIFTVSQPVKQIATTRLKLSCAIALTTSCLEIRA